MISKHHHSDIGRFIAHLNAAINNIRLYSISHPQAGRYIQIAFTDISDLLRSQNTITLILVDEDIVIDHQPLQADRSNISSFIRILKENAIERITFSNGLPENDFSDFIFRLASPVTQSIMSGPFIKVGKVSLKIKPQAIEGQSALSSDQTETIAHLKEVRDRKLEEVKSLYNRAKGHRKINVAGFDDMLKAFIKGFSKGLPPMALLAILKSADEYTFTHVINVCILTMSQAESLGFKGEYLYQIGIASVLHDVGKLFVPEEIIRKPDMLTREERSIIETHTIKGAKYILNLENIPKLAVLGAMEHHIKYNGSGYPLIRGGWQPNIVSQMIAIADVFDALRSRRSYSEPKSLELIKQILQQEKGTTFNPFLVDNFLKLIER